MSNRAELLLGAYQHYTTVEKRGAALLDGEMIHEASRKLAMVAASRGRAPRRRPGQDPAIPAARLTAYRTTAVPPG